MKITKAQLTQLIKEELAVLMKEADIAPLQKELMDAVGVIANAYEGVELPPPVADLKAMIEAGNLLQASHDIVDMWNELLVYHRDAGRAGQKLPRVPSTAFNATFRLLKKVPDSIGGQVGQRTPQRPIDRDKDGNRIPVFEESSAEVDRVVSNMLQRDMKREELELLRMKLDDMIRQLSAEEEGHGSGRDKVYDDEEREAKLAGASQSMSPEEQEDYMKLYNLDEGMLDAIKNKLSPKRPEAAKAPRARRERNEHEKKAARQQGGADAYDFNRGMLEKPNRPNDEDYMAGWNSALQEGTNKMKITKSKLAQIVQEELQAVTAEGYKAYNRDDDERIYPKRELSRHAAAMAQNKKNGYSPQAAVTAIPDHEEGMKAYFNSLSKKPKRESQLSESDVDPIEAGQDEGIQEFIYQQIADNLQDGPLPADSILSLTEPEYESPYEHLADQWEDILAAALHEMSEADEGSDYRIEKSHDTMTGEPYYSPIGFLS